VSCPRLRPITSWRRSGKAVYTYSWDRTLAGILHGASKREQCKCGGRRFRATRELPLRLVQEHARNDRILPEPFSQVVKCRVELLPPFAAPLVIQERHLPGRKARGEAG